MKDLPQCDRGQSQTIKHIVEEFPQTRYNEGLHEGDEEAINLLTVLDRCSPLNIFFHMFIIIYLSLILNCFLFFNILI